MGSSRLLTVLAAALCAAVLAPAAAAAEAADSVNLGAGGGQLMKHCRAVIALAEYEHAARPGISVLARVSGISYAFDDGWYQERGRPRGVDAGLRYYPSGGMSGVFLGGSVGYWMTDWRFTDAQGRPTESKGDGDTRALRVNIELGARIPLGSSALSVMPALNAGRFVSSTSCRYTAPASAIGTSCSRESEVRAYVFWSVLAGIAF